MTVPEKHQRNIAYKTLKMNPVMARIMGGMDFEEAYKFIFGIDLKERLSQLIKDYPNAGGLCWELNEYGWNDPKELLNQL